MQNVETLKDLLLEPSTLGVYLKILEENDIHIDEEAVRAIRCI